MNNAFQPGGRAVVTGPETSRHKGSTGTVVVVRDTVVELLLDGERRPRNFPAGSVAPTGVSTSGD